MRHPAEPSCAHKPLPSCPAIALADSVPAFFFFWNRVVAILPSAARPALKWRPAGPHTDWRLSGCGGFPPAAATQKPREGVHRLPPSASRGGPCPRRSQRPPWSAVRGAACVPATGAAEDPRQPASGGGAGGGAVGACCGDGLRGCNRGRRRLHLLTEREIPSGRHGHAMGVGKTLRGLAGATTPSAPASAPGPHQKTSLPSGAGVRTRGHGAWRRRCDPSGDARGSQQGLARRPRHKTPRSTRTCFPGPRYVGWAPRQ